jgi:hypothetical protein
MASREGTWWSRAWGTIAVAAFAVHLGAAVYEAAVLAPLWSIDPPKSVAAWSAFTEHPDSSSLFHPLVAIIFLATVMSWLSGILTRGWRRWWLTLALVSACALAAVTVQLVIPVERELFGGGVAGANDATVVAWTGDWIRAAALRGAALLVGTWSAYRAQLAGMLAERIVVAARAGDEFVDDDAPGAGRRTRRAREFAFGDEPDTDLTIGDDAVHPFQPRQRWRQSLPDRRRTAKK